MAAERRSCLTKMRTPKLASIRAFLHPPSSSEGSQSLQQNHGSESLQSHEQRQPQSFSHGLSHLQFRLPRLVCAAEVGKGIGVFESHEQRQPQSGSHGLSQVQSLPTSVTNGFRPGSEMLRQDTGQLFLTSARPEHRPATRDSCWHEENVPLVALETAESGASSRANAWPGRAVVHPATSKNASVDGALMIAASEGTLG